MRMCDCSTSSSLSSYSYIRFPFHLFPFPPSFASKPPKFSLKATQTPNPNSKPDQFKFKERQTTKSQFKLNRNDDEEIEFLRFDEDSTETEGDEEDLVKNGDESDVKLGELDIRKGNEVNVIIRKGKELMKRSNVIGKQWMVVIVEVRPNLLSGQQEMFFLEDTRQVGDVVLIEDETVMDKEFKMVGLETLVGYSVVTPSRRDIGKVRGYTFNINSGVIESLELDSFGISIIPSSLVSTYALMVEDVLEVVLDTVVVHDAAASRIQRLTKGFWDSQRTNYSMDDLDYYSDLEEQTEYRKGRRRRPGAGNPRPRDKPIDNTQEDWDLPMDYL